MALMRHSEPVQIESCTRREFRGLQLNWIPYISKNKLKKFTCHPLKNMFKTCNFVKNNNFEGRPVQDRDIFSVPTIPKGVKLLLDPKDLQIQEKCPYVCMYVCSFPSLPYQPRLTQVNPREPKGTLYSGIFRLNDRNWCNSSWCNSSQK